MIATIVIKRGDVIMDKHLQTIEKIKQDQMIKSFHENNIEIFFLEDKQELENYLKTVLKENKTVAVGGSMTLFEAGVIDLIKNSDVQFFNRYQEGLTREQIQDVFRQAFTADIFITSTNALSEDGCLYNVDGNGNRVAAMIYGPKEVIVIAGKNKIFANEQEAINHIRTVSAPANATRLNKATPCTKVGHCMDCKSPQRICSSYVKLGYQGNVNRIKVIILNDLYGY